MNCGYLPPKIGIVDNKKPNVVIYYLIFSPFDRILQMLPIFLKPEEWDSLISNFYAMMKKMTEYLCLGPICG